LERERNAKRRGREGGREGGRERERERERERKKERERRRKAWRCPVRAQQQRAATIYKMGARARGVSYLSKRFSKWLLAVIGLV
jgi:hypothetical protein